MFDYEYVSLTPEQVEARRKLLDHAGWQAYLAPTILLAALASYNSVISSKRLLSNRNEEPPAVTLLTRRISWILDTTYIPEFGPVRVQLLGFIYTAYLLFQIFNKTGNDYMHVTKAFGHVAVSQLPMHYVLSTKSSYSPIIKVTGLTHERMNAYHRLYGRIIHSLLATHAVLYLRFFAKMNLLSKRIKDWDVRLGIMAFWVINFLGLLAIPPIRAKVYHKVFYRSHIILSALLLVVLWFHVPYSRIYVWRAAWAWVVNGVLRKGASQSAKVRCEMVGNDLVRVEAVMQGKHLYSYVPGCHVYLNRSGLGPRTPFTVVSAKALKQGETEVELVAKNTHGPMTAALAVAAHDNSTITLDLEGPYGEAQVYMPDLMHEIRRKGGRFLLIAGGVGATYTLPIYKALLDAGADSKNVRLIWVVRKGEDVKWAASFMVTRKNVSPIVVHITRPEGVDVQVLKEDKSPRSCRPNFDVYVDDLFNERLSPSSKNGNELVKDPTKADQRLHDTVTVMVCGPRGLTSAARTAVGKHVWDYGRDVRWYEEQFGFGGS
ncbi:hypothetical protein PMZ80_001880 [Knufia obscura]|uniref:FAD-binding FR-type domain-containing protein n=1 Tax=Knufia obscura TaxID=1635080 RepID=A0ABR0RVR7_9EURO|nr:hypothetical protein PMZ80_001880 [Knufia obscura]